MGDPSHIHPTTLRPSEVNMNEEVNSRDVPYLGECRVARMDGREHLSKEKCTSLNLGVCYEVGTPCSIFVFNLGAEFSWVIFSPVEKLGGYFRPS